MMPVENTWSAYPDAAGRGPAPAGAVDEPGRAVGLGAVCALRAQTSDGDRAQSFRVREFLRLEDGRMVVLHDDRGFTLGSGDGAPVEDGLTAAVLTQNVLNVVLPDDDDTGEDHPWEWLAALARARGIEATADDLRALPYEVILADEVTRWLAGSSGGAPPSDSG